MRMGDEAAVYRGMDEQVPALQSLRTDPHGLQKGDDGHAEPSRKREPHWLRVLSV